MIQAFFLCQFGDVNNREMQLGNFSEFLEASASVFCRPTPSPRPHKTLLPTAPCKSVSEIECQTMWQGI